MWTYLEHHETSGKNRNVINLTFDLNRIISIQECTQVGCVPHEAEAVHGGSASVHAGIDHLVWAWRPPPPECGPGDPSTSPWVWAWRSPWRPVRHAGIPAQGDLCNACWDSTCNACWDTTPPPVNRITDTYKNITLPQLRCGR